MGLMPAAEFRFRANEGRRSNRPRTRRLATVLNQPKLHSNRNLRTCHWFGAEIVTLLRTNSLSPVLRGEGWGEGLYLYRLGPSP
jgi:hypothetical protein